MKKVYVLVVFFMSLVVQGYSQKPLSDYSYIIVSEQFEFQDVEDKYQLNSLIKFLYNKYGFHAYFKDEVPANVRRCDGLYADAEGKPGFIITKVEHVIRDCDGNEVFRSIKGKSDIKDYKKAYYEATREAFKSVRDLYVNQKEISVYEDVTAVKKVSNATKPKKEMATSVVIANEVKNEKPKEANSSTSEAVTKENLPSAKFSNYSNLDKTFLLRKTKEGYSFYEESSASEDGLLLIGKIIGLDAGILFIDSNKNKLTAQFDAAQNLIIEKEEGEVVYKLER